MGANVASIEPRRKHSARLEAYFVEDSGVTMSFDHPRLVYIHDLILVPKSAQMLNTGTQWIKPMHDPAREDNRAGHGFVRGVGYGYIRQS